jgi:hypothetical protein
MTLIQWLARGPVVGNFSASPDIRVPCRGRGRTTSGDRRRGAVALSGDEQRRGGSGGGERQRRVGTSSGGGAGREQGQQIRFGVGIFWSWPTGHASKWSPRWARPVAPIAVDRIVS